MAQLPSLEHDTGLTAAKLPVLSAAIPGTRIALFRVPEARANVKLDSKPTATEGTPKTATAKIFERGDGDLFK